MGKNEPKSSNIPYSHTSFHASGQKNFDIIGKSGRVSINNINEANGKSAVGKFEKANGETIKINPKAD